MIFFFAYLQLPIKKKKKKKPLWWQECEEKDIFTRYWQDCKLEQDNISERKFGSVQ